MARDLGTKHVCFKCATKFYDLKKPAPICPKCGADQREAPVLKPATAAQRRAAAAEAAREEEEAEVPGIEEEETEAAEEAEEEPAAAEDEN
jgi:uncharacterized protein (TIGR02300 family)